MLAGTCKNVCKAHARAVLDAVSQCLPLNPQKFKSQVKQDPGTRRGGGSLRGPWRPGTDQAHLLAEEAWQLLAQATAVIVLEQNSMFDVRASSGRRRWQAGKHEQVQDALIDQSCSGCFPRCPSGKIVLGGVGSGKCGKLANV